MKKGERTALAVAVILILPSFASCRRENALWKGKITVENGVTVVSNPAKPMLRVTLGKGQDRY